MSTICSACGSQLLSGSATCPACHLPITAFAMPVQPPTPKRTSWLFVLALIAAALYGLGILGQTLDKHDQTKLLMELHNGALSDPASFQAHCGPAAIRYSQNHAPMLDYGTLLVTFPDSAVHFSRKVDSDRLPDGMPSDEQWALDQIKCKP